MENTSQYTFKKKGMSISVGNTKYTEADLNEKNVNVLRNIIPDFDKLLKNGKKQKDNIGISKGGDNKESKELEDKGQ